MQKNSNQTKAKILNAATKLFAKKGFAVTSMNDIAAQVKIEKSSLYYFYKNKNDIFSAALEKSWKNLIYDLENILLTSKNKTKSDLNKSLNKIIEKIISYGLKSGLTIIDISSNKIMSHCTCELVYKQMQQIKKIIITILKTANYKDSELAQQVIMNSIHAYVIHAQYHKQTARPAAYAAYLTNLFI